MTNKSNKNGAKKINLSNLQKQAKQVFTQKEIMVGEYSVKIDVQFKPSKIQLLAKELLEKSDYIKDNNVDLDIASFALILLVKYFSDVEVPDEFDQELELYKLLIDNEYLSPIIGAFDETEIAKITEFTKQAKLNLDKLIVDARAEAIKDQE